MNRTWQLRLRHPRQTLGSALAVWAIVGQIQVRRLWQQGRGRQMPAIVEQISTELLSWPGVTQAPHRYGGVEFRLGKRELGHLHGDYLADLPFPISVREDLVANRQAMAHHILPLSGWVSYPIRDAAAVPGAIALFRLAYQRATKAAR